MTPLQEAQLARAAGLSPLLALLPLVEAEVDKLQEAVVKRALASIKAGTLDQAAAHALWAEYAALESVIVRLNQRVNVGKTAAEDVAGVLTGPPRAR